MKHRAFYSPFLLAASAAAANAADDVIAIEVNDSAALEPASPQSSSPAVYLGRIPQIERCDFGGQQRI
jgi:hypothetical protein